MLSRKEIIRRKPLWQALSDLWLADYEFERTETNRLKKEVLSAAHTSEELESVFPFYENYDLNTVKAMISSEYSLNEIEKILFEEVAPVVYKNALDYGGTWGAFDSDWLFKGILENLKKQERNPLYRAWVKSSLGKCIMTKMVQEDWNKIVNLYE